MKKLSFLILIFFFSVGAFSKTPDNPEDDKSWSKYSTMNIDNNALQKAAKILNANEKSFIKVYNMGRLNWDEMFLTITLVGFFEEHPKYQEIQVSKLRTLRKAVDAAGDDPVTDKMIKSLQPRVNKIFEDTIRAVLMWGSGH